MVESWNMSTRLLMLTLTVGAFVAMWSGDHQDSSPDQAKLERIRSFKGTLPDRKLPIIHAVKVTLFLEDDEAESDQNSVSDSTETGFSLVCLPEEDWMSLKKEEFHEEFDSTRPRQMFASSLKTEDWDLTSTILWNHYSEVTVDDRDKAIPLPVDLAPGEYRIFNEEGAEYVKRWTAEELASIGIPDSVPALNSYMLEEEGRTWFYFREDQPEIISTSIESETEQAAGISVFSEACDGNASVSFGPTEPIAERILCVKETLEMSVCRMKWFFNLLHLNVKSTIHEAADSWVGMIADAIQQTRQHWERTEGISTKTARVETPILNIRTANRIRCQQFH
jgi:hypothetical protein